MAETKTVPDVEAVNGPKAAPEQNGSLKHVVHTFAEESTIPAVKVVHKNVHWFRKLVWTVIVVTGLTVCIYQAIILIINYLKYPSFITEEEKMNRTLYFPSITLCPKSIINWEKVIATNHYLLRSIDKEANELIKEVPNIRRERLNDLMVNELYRMSKTEREKVMMKVDDWLLQCIVDSAENQDFDCIANKDFRVFTYSPYYGSCITINPGFTETSKLRLSNIDEIKVIARIRPAMEFPYSDSLPGVALTMHTSGSAPVIGLNKGLYALPGQLLQIGITVSDVQRLHAPFASNCTEEYEALPHVLREATPYYTEETPYSYSREECLVTCYMQSMLHDNKCFYRYVATNEKYDSLRYQLCAANERNETMMKIEDSCSKTCRKRCREFVYDWTPITTTISKRIGYLQDFMNHEANANMMENEDFIVIYLKIDSNSYVYEEETEDYKLAAVFGTIGGNAGLWIGLSVLSTFEVIELFIDIVIHFIRKICKKKKP